LISTISLKYGDGNIETLNLTLKRWGEGVDEVLRGTLPPDSVFAGEMINLFYDPKSDSIRSFVGEVPRLGCETPQVKPMDSESKELLKTLIRKNTYTNNNPIKLNKSLLQTKTGGDDDISHKIKSNKSGFNKGMFKIKVESYIRKVLRDDLLRYK
jgi:hypothetical protein